MSYRSLIKTKGCPTFAGALHPSVGVALQRIRQRVRKGGHNVPKDDVKRRFHASRFNLYELYLPLAAKTMIFDASSHPPKLVVEFSNNTENITDAKIYEQIKKTLGRFG